MNIINEIYPNELKSESNQESQITLDIKYVQKTKKTC